MFARLFLLFTLVPIAELWLLIRIGGAIGLVPTLGLVVATGAAGAWLARREGLKSWLAVQRELASGGIPGEEIGHGVLILIAGIVLLTPGVITDALGLALLVRPVRRSLITRLRSRVETQIQNGTTGFVAGPGAGVFWSGPGTPGVRPGEEAGVRPGGERRPGAGYPAGREIIVEDDPAG
jgi:UPF0716 protein FxsA